MLSKNSAFVLLKELHHVLESILEQRTRSMRKNLRESDPEPVIFLKSVLEPDLEPPENLSGF